MILPVEGVTNGGTYFINTRSHLQREKVLTILVKQGWRWHGIALTSRSHANFINNEVEYIMTNYSFRRYPVIGVSKANKTLVGYRHVSDESSVVLLANEFLRAVNSPVRRANNTRTRDEIRGLPIGETTEQNAPLAQAQDESPF